MGVVRTFVAVLIDDDLKSRIAGVQDRLRQLAPDVKWVAPETLHVTLKFLGDVDEDALPEIYAAVDEAVRPHQRFEFSISDVGAFPNARNPRVVWVGIEEGRDRVRELALAVDESLARLGFGREEKEFRAHITIGRVKTSRFLRELARGIGEVDARSLGVQRVASVAVMKSELQREGPTYTPLKVTDLS